LIQSELGKLATPTPAMHHDYLVNSVQSSTSMFMNPIDPTEIVNVIRRLKDNKSPSYEYISTKAVKAVAQFISNIH